MYSLLIPGYFEHLGTEGRRIHWDWISLFKAGKESIPLQFERGVKPVRKSTLGLDTPGGALSIHRADVDIF